MVYGGRPRGLLWGFQAPLVLGRCRSPWRRWLLAREPAGLVDSASRLLPPRGLAQ